MRVLVLGGSGMLGHKVHEILSHRHEVVSTMCRRVASLPVDASPFLTQGRVVEGFDALDLAQVRGLVEGFAPDALINCVGVVKQRAAASDAVTSIEVNALLPHRLAVLCGERGVRLIHFSTDCVFSGARGDYTEDDLPDATDLYGRTKFLGEVAGDRCLAVRTSIIGRELDHFQSLVEWFLGQRGTIPGFTNAIYTGLTTLEMTRLVERLLLEHRELSGLFQVASRKITKFDLLLMLRDALGVQDQVEIVPEDSFLCDRSLSGARLLAATGIEPPPWGKMVDELAADALRYRRAG